ncbi:hypothetical protein CONPUDRAFT_157075 [Coniophora puteana RWD-64-598 SS2]|uniref:Uncharacterized protein n=1 Tax=Coniophora puteana (strain RWD-64-598) TaxID=741705 RepID=A0A5M3MGZ0_CONPW|nr:uncharacterized protein CONPUDRAFT_157075 [Coniophora puteana RWD-64-598 SS2]EIW77895.1 hypothetical protein CONPUDRAFT_157075 [Coniophora puteana RWD-64-598 SS2]
MQLLKIKPVQWADDYQFNAYTTWEISIARLTENAVNLLQHCAFMHHSGIQQEIFRAAYDSSEWPENQRLPFLEGFLDGHGQWDMLKFYDVVKELLECSLVHSSHGSYDIHPLIHQWLSDKVENKAVLQAEVAQILVLAVPSGGRSRRTQDALSLKRMLYVHMQHVDKAGLSIQVAEKWAEVFRDMGNWAGELKLRELVYDENMKLYGFENQRTLVTKD